MIEAIGIIVTALIAFGALTVSFLAHRHQVRLAAVLEAKERRLEILERQMAARQADLDRAEILAQASVIDIRVVMRSSALAEGLQTAELLVTNLSNQPVLDLGAQIADARVVSISGSIPSSSSRSFPLPQQQAQTATRSPMQLNVEFTDAGGIRWRRDGGGGLREGARLETGEWTWSPREGPMVTIVGQTAGSQGADGPSALSNHASYSGSFARRRRWGLPLMAAGVLLAVITWVVWTFW
ncbi:MULTISPECIES: hypothetical protein [unclassified Streptomyces]|uniref:hypothetical protein n=1 Tax=unclassified Streptomyces TaxID=2593676 RepID=UPI00093BEA9E|nr:hypothetical protein [Streptomyces sp. TSRI0281]OKI41302.1 hypothetical protein A6A29_38225 [Streptomyces sp. TSRI0281]